MPHAAAYIATLLVFLGLDAIWLSLIAGKMYRRTLRDVMIDKIKVAPAVIFYPFYVVGIVVFAVVPALHAASWQSALVHGALFGFFAYGLYEFTNLATIRNWTLQLALTDLAWGTIVSGVAAVAGCMAAMALT